MPTFLNATLINDCINSSTQSLNDLLIGTTKTIARTITRPTHPPRPFSHIFSEFIFKTAQLQHQEK